MQTLTYERILALAFVVCAAHAQTGPVSDPAAASNAPALAIESPSQFQGWVKLGQIGFQETVSGWAVSQFAAISSVQIEVDGAVVGTAVYGGNRPDICSSYVGWVGCPNVGYTFTLNTSSLTYGLHVITAVATGGGATPSSASTSVTVRVVTGTASPFTKVGVFRNGNSFLLDSNGNQAFDSGIDRFITTFIPPGGSQAGDVGVAGDWSGDGFGKVGIYRPSTGQWFLDANNDGIWDAGDSNYPNGYNFGGLAGDIPVVGDWAGYGKSCVGLFRSGFLWVLDLNCNGSFDGTPTDAAFPFGGLAGDVPVVGNWTGGNTRVAVVRKYAPGGIPQGPPFFWVMDNVDATAGSAAQTHQPAAGAFPFGGIDGDQFVSGDWIGAGISRAGVYRNGAWLLDLTGAHTYDTFFGFGGLASDTPITGKW